jgi:hypothetical protein
MVDSLPPASNVARDRLEIVAMTWGEGGVWFSGSATFTAALVALFKDWILTFFYRPVLHAVLDDRAPIVEKTAISRNGHTIPCYYLRLWISNEGNVAAEQVQVFAADLERRSADGHFRPVPGYIPMNLRWTHGVQPGNRAEVFSEIISPKMGRFCDIGRIVDPTKRLEVGDDRPDFEPDQPVLSLSLEVFPSTGSHLIGPDVYRLTLKVAAKNRRPESYTLEITFSAWYDDYVKMREDGIGMRLH